MTDMIEAAEKLLPCPCCNGDVEAVGADIPTSREITIRCARVQKSGLRGCGIRIAGKRIRISHAQLLADLTTRWNTRQAAGIAVPVVTDEMEESVRSVPAVEHHCDGEDGDTVGWRYIVNDKLSFWVGEVSRDLFENADCADLGNDTGIFLVRFDDVAKDSTILCRCPDWERGKELAHAIAIFFTKTGREVAKLQTCDFCMEKTATPCRDVNDECQRFAALSLPRAPTQGEALTDRLEQIAADELLNGGHRTHGLIMEAVRLIRTASGERGVAEIPRHVGKAIRQFLSAENELRLAERTGEQPRLQKAGNRFATKRYALERCIAAPQTGKAK